MEDEWSDIKGSKRLARVPAHGSRYLAADVDRLLAYGRVERQCALNSLVRGEFAAEIGVVGLLPYLVG
jgi:hypothetical protein